MLLSQGYFEKSVSTLKENILQKPIIFPKFQTLLLCGVYFIASEKFQVKLPYDEFNRLADVYA
jgi:hypothetical protein